jgi:hypothetical protein
MYFSTPTFASFGLTAGILLIYFTEWKVVGQYIPFWRQKLYPKDRPL